ncbi:putative serine/threonine protein kinase [Hibiscus syriacus]|uniref:Serine/threonine protein kinase n=1 Tax=Hibiscus syriacus TaxID=106335 RepID=A0A6A3CMC7_HIBSY|nr:putative serine/threonine protein kinase [Hibiscus syriacus]
MAVSEVYNDRGELRILEDLDELRTDLADYIADLSDAAVKERGVFATALSGGSLIHLMGSFFGWENSKLCEAPYNKTMPIVPSHVHSINDSVSAEEAADDYMFVIRQLVKTRMVSVPDINDCAKFDLILLGMGPDGHIASLFPNHSALDETDKWVTFIIGSPKTPPERIHSLCLSSIQHQT